MQHLVEPGQKQPVVAGDSYQPLRLFGIGGLGKEGRVLVICRALFFYDLPDLPNRLGSRIGRDAELRPVDRENILVHPRCKQRLATASSNVDGRFAQLFRSVDADIADKNRYTANPGN
jgi:hypothetical protein